LHQAANAAESSEHSREGKDVMNTVTYGGARVLRTAVSQRTKAKKRKRFFARFMDALTKSRRQQARRMIEDHAYLLSNDPDSPV
jgi:hypothetical protein